MRRSGALPAEGRIYFEQGRNEERGNAGDEDPQKEIKVAHVVLDPPANIPGTIMPRAMKPVQMA